MRQMSSQAEALSKIGNRDIVGYGWNGQPSYQDRVDYPMPAVRFRENTPDVMVSSLISELTFCSLIELVVDH